MHYGLDIQFGLQILGSFIFPVFTKFLKLALYKLSVYIYCTQPVPYPAGISYRYNGMGAQTNVPK